MESGARCHVSGSQIRVIGEVLCVGQEGGYPRQMSALGQQRKSEAAPGMSAPGGEADVIR